MVDNNCLEDPFSDHPFSCRICGKNFGQKKHCKRHIVNAHINTVPSFCEVCQKNYKNIDTLRTHQRIAHGIYAQPDTVIGHWQSDLMQEFGATCLRTLTAPVEQLVPSVEKLSPTIEIVGGMLRTSIMAWAGSLMAPTFKIWLFLRWLWNKHKQRMFVLLLLVWCLCPFQASKS